MNAMNAVPRRCAGIGHELKATDESVIFDEEGHQLLVLNDVAAAIWYLIDGVRTVEEIATIVAEHVDVERPRLVADVDRFVRELEQKKLVAVEAAS